MNEHSEKYKLFSVPPQMYKLFHTSVSLLFLSLKPPSPSSQRSPILSSKFSSDSCSPWPHQTELTTLFSAFLNFVDIHLHHCSCQAASLTSETIFSSDPCHSLWGVVQRTWSFIKPLTLWILLIWLQSKQSLSASNFLPDAGQTHKLTSLAHTSVEITF